MPNRLNRTVQPLAGIFNAQQVAVGTQAGVKDRNELTPRQIGLFLVVVDVVVPDDLLFGSLPRLAGAQNDAYVEIADHFTDMARQIQACMLGLHHHIEQYQGDVVGL